MNLFRRPPEKTTSSSRELRTLRDRHAALVDSIDRSAPGSRAFSSARVALKIFNGGAMATSGNHYFLGNPVTLTGTECEGCSDVVQADLSTVYKVFVLGTRAPAAGDTLTAYGVGNRWVSELGTSQPGCGIQLCIDACNGIPQVGATVTVSKSGFSTSGTTTATLGCVNLIIPDTDTYTVAVSISGNTVYSQSQTLNCNTTVNINIGTSPVGAICCANLPCSSLPCNGVIFNDTLFITDGCGTTALTGGSLDVGETARWTGCTQCTIDAEATTNQTVDGAGVCTLGGTQVSVLYTLNCSCSTDTTGCQGDVPTPYMFTVERTWNACTIVTGPGPDDATCFPCMNTFGTGEENCVPQVNGTSNPCGSAGHDVSCFNPSGCIPFLASGTFLLGTCGPTGNLTTSPLSLEYMISS